MKTMRTAGIMKITRMVGIMGITRTVSLILNARSCHRILASINVGLNPNEEADGAHIHAANLGGKARKQQ
jgi:hypothetical protein